MRPVDRLSCAGRAIALAASLCGAVLLTGCGMPAAPQPPSLKLPEPVKDLTAKRTGEAVSLAWTMPKRDTSKVALKPGVAVAARVCRSEGAMGACETVAHLGFKPGADGAFTETLPPALATGSLRPVRYFVELINRRGRSAGLSNAAIVLAGQAPAAVASLTAEMHKGGVALHWTPGPPEPYETQVRLVRTLLTPPTKSIPESGPRSGSKTASKSTEGPLAPPAEPVERNLLVPNSEVRGGALDKDIRFGETYSYRAQRVARVSVDGKTLELDGPLSPPVRIDAENVFPPSVPTGLAAVATPAENGVRPSIGPSIDLSWQPDTEADVAGYAVYRRDVAAGGQPTGAWQRISPAQPVIGPGYHDANVEPGHTYEYTVTAIGQNGRESARSEPAEETVPQP